MDIIMGGPEGPGEYVRVAPPGSDECLELELLVFGEPGRGASRLVQPSLDDVVVEAAVRPIVAGMSDNEALFWNFVYERHAAWHRRYELRLPREQWTDDPVIAAARFTNVYRVLDRGTQYWVATAEEHANYGPEWLCFHLLAYRFFNRIQTEQAARGALYGAFSAGDWGGLAAALNGVRAAGDSLYTGSYISTYCPDMGTGDHVLNAVEVLKGARAAAPKVAEAVLTGSLRDVFAEVKKLKGFGDFLSYQAALDFTYPLLALGGRAPMSRPQTEEDWAQPGPGAKAGLKLLGASARNPVDAMKALRDGQERALAACGIDFPWLSVSARAYGGQGRVDLRLSLPNVEHALCEFQKWHRIASGKPARKPYRGPEAGDHWRPAFKITPAWD